MLNAKERARFESKIAPADASGCRRWMASGSTGTFKHGSMKDGTRRGTLAVRLAYQMAHGEIPEGHVVVATCGTRGCVEPSHLATATREDFHRSDARSRVRDLAERFWEKCCPEPNTGCWLWTGSTCRAGYGMFAVQPGIGAPKARAHRVAWELTRGSTPPGLFVCHRCDTPACVNPAHLWLGTAGDNNRDRHAKGRNGRIDSSVLSAILRERAPRGLRNGRHTRPERTCRGARHPKAVFDEAMVFAIRGRAAAGERVSVLAREFDRPVEAVRRLIKRKTWKHLP